MILNIKKRTINLHLRRFLYLFLISMSIILLYYIKIFGNPVLGISRTGYTIILVSLYILYFIIGFIRNYHFFLFSDNGTKLVFRFYSLRPLNKKQSAIEIEKHTFYNHKIENVFWGFIRRLYLSQKMPNGTIAKYPPINITLLSKKEIKLLNEALIKYRN